MQSDGDWEIRAEELRAPSVVEALWRDLQARADRSFFQSWGWIGAWLKTFPEDAGLLFLQVRLEGRVVGLSVLGRNTITRDRFFTSKALLVSEVGNPNHDALTVEHSGLLVERGLEDEVITRALAYLKEMDWRWDELHVSGVELSHAEAYVRSAARVGLVPTVSAEHPYFFVDLAGLRNDGEDYLSTLSRNTRHQIRRSLRLFETQEGAVRIDVADSVGDALEVFEALRSVHQACWEGRGQPGAFASERATKFHRSLIEACFDAGEVQLARVSAGEHDFGYLYNFVMDGVVSNYQTGFRYREDARFKPGLVSHVLAVRYNAEQGRDVYDFLMGDQRFKRSLAKREERMLWLVLERAGGDRSLGARMRDVARWFSGRR